LVLSNLLLYYDELSKEIENSFVPQQFKNPANPDIHRHTTALEIWNDTEGKIDVLVAGVGTGEKLQVLVKH
jgi:cysteine synthase A